MQLLVIQFKIKMFHIGFMQVLILQSLKSQYIKIFCWTKWLHSFSVTLAWCFCRSCRFLSVGPLLLQYLVPCIFLFCTLTNKCTIISQIIKLLHVSTLSCRPQEACNQYLAKLHKYFKCSCSFSYYRHWNLHIIKSLTL